LLKSLGLDKPLFEPKEKPRKAKPENKKRKTPAEVDEDSSEPAKVPRTASESVADTGVRRSSRNAGKKIDYKAEQQLRHTLPLSYSSGVKITDNTGPLGREDGIRKYDP
jgi:E3 ubiquitin-protein ligase UHRF1